MTENVSPSPRRRYYIPLIIVGCFVLIVLFIVGVRLYFRLPVKDYYEYSRQAFEIPDLNSGFIAQGIAYDASEEIFMITGYMNSSKASPVYLMAPDGELLNCVLLADEDGNPFTGHSGGITVHGDYVYLAGSSDKCVYVYDRNSIYDSDYGTYVRRLGKVDVGLRVSFTASDEEMIYVGEYYHTDYKTPEEHKLTTADGTYNQAVAIAYRFADSPSLRFSSAPYPEAVFGIIPVPCSAYSIPDMVQGITVENGKIYCSCSKGLSFSHIYTYSLDKAGRDSLFVHDGVSVPLYELDSASKTAECKLPPMSEEIIIYKKHLYTMCESASNKYFFGKLTGANYCYSTKLDFIENNIAGTD